MKMRVLIVEDEPDTTRQLTDLLQADFNNIEVEAAPTGTSAIKSITDMAEAGGTFDVLLLDLKLSDEEGSSPKLNADVFRTVRDKMKSSVVIHTTAYPNDPEVTHFILNETMKSPVGPRSLFLPRTDPSWLDEVCRIIEQIKR